MSPMKRNATVSDLDSDGDPDPTSRTTPVDAAALPKPLVLSSPAIFALALIGGLMGILFLIGLVSRLLDKVTRGNITGRYRRSISQASPHKRKRAVLQKPRPKKSTPQVAFHPKNFEALTSTSTLIPGEEQYNRFDCVSLVQDSDEVFVHVVHQSTPPKTEEDSVSVYSWETFIVLGGDGDSLRDSGASVTPVSRPQTPLPPIVDYPDNGSIWIDSRPGSPSSSSRTPPKGPLTPGPSPLRDVTNVRDTMSSLGFYGESVLRSLYMEDAYSSPVVPRQIADHDDLDGTEASHSIPSTSTHNETAHVRAVSRPALRPLTLVAKVYSSPVVRVSSGDQAHENSSALTPRRSISPSDVHDITSSPAAFSTSRPSSYGSNSNSGSAIRTALRPLALSGKFHANIFTAPSTPGETDNSTPSTTSGRLAHILATNGSPVQGGLKRLVYTRSYTVNGSPSQSSPRFPSPTNASTVALLSSPPTPSTPSAYSSDSSPASSPLPTPILAVQASQPIVVSEFSSDVHTTISNVTRAISTKPQPKINRASPPLKALMVNPVNVTVAIPATGEILTFTLSVDMPFAEFREMVHAAFGFAVRLRAAPSSSSSPSSPGDEVDDGQGSRSARKPTKDVYEGAVMDSEMTFGGFVAMRAESRRGCFLLGEKI